MKPARRAVIDVGTNSVKLLVADVSGREVQPVWEESKQTRLGRGFYETHRLQPDAIDATGKAVAQFSETAGKHQANSVRVIATSAARDAVNADELSSAIERASGLKMEIVSGEQEADWVFQGVTTDPTLAGPAGQMLLLLDVGGGSTELILGLGEQICFRQSFPLGTVRLLEKYPPSDPPAAGEDDTPAYRKMFRITQPIVVQQPLQENVVRRIECLRTSMAENMIRLRAAIEASQRRIDAVMAAIREQISDSSPYNSNGRVHGQSVSCGRSIRA